MTDRRALRVGVTGHRRLADPSAVARAVDDVLDRLTAQHPVDLVAVSSLAEGADRLVVDRVLTRGGTLHAVLPLAPDDFATDFADASSRDEFTRLLGAASTVECSPSQESRQAAYEHAGRTVLAFCDVLLALWDGGPARGRGGTAELVAEARACGRPVEVITVERGVNAPAP